MPGPFIGIIYDIVSDTIIERGCIERDNEDEALTDAHALCDAEGFDRADGYVYDLKFNAINFD